MTSSEQKIENSNFLEQTETREMLQDLNNSIKIPENSEESSDVWSDLVLYENYDEVKIEWPWDKLPHFILRENSDGYHELQKLVEWVNNNYKYEYSKKKNELEEEYSKPENLLIKLINEEKTEQLKKEYIKYELFMFCLQKYSTEVNKIHQEIITWVYWNEQEYQKAMKLAPQIFQKIQDTINRTYPWIQNDIQELSKVFNKIELQRQGWNIKDEKKEEEKYQNYQEKIQKLAKTYDIENVKKNLNIEPQNPAEAKKMGEDLWKILEFSEKEKQIKQDCNVSSNYEHYLNNKMFLINQYGKNKFFAQTQKIWEYQRSLNEIQKWVYEWFDFEKYQQYLDKVKEQNFSFSRYLNNYSR